MTTYFLDTSAIFKRYVSEVGTPWIEALAAPDTGNIIYIAEITRVEIISALARRYREGSLSAAQVNQAIEIFKIDLANQYDAIEPCEMLLELAGLLLLVHPLRAYDAVQLASAMLAQFRLPSTSVVFLTADDRLLTAATAEGLLTDNPNLHP